MKRAIYVEGVTEAGFVYRLIREHYNDNWSLFRVECLNLAPKDAADDLYNYGADDAPDYYLIYDSCSDTAVSSDIKNRIDNHLKAGFDKVIGLRDVYSENYKELYQQKFDRHTIDIFIKDMRDALSQYTNEKTTRLCFAIMEIEAWFLAIGDVFHRIDSRLDYDWLCNNVNIDLSKDPETDYYHPYSKLEDIYSSISKPYGKHWERIKEIIFKLKQSDFDYLYNSGKCNSFKEFYDVVFNNQ